MDFQKRQEKETREVYRARLSKEKKEFKQHMLGRVLWDSMRLGTYIRARDGELV